MNKKSVYKRIIEQYIKAYNDFDIDRMLINMDDHVKFENISNGQVSLTTNGIEELREQAQQAKNLFSDRQQKIKSIKHNNDLVEVEIDYKGTLAVDLPNGPKAEELLQLKGKSIFKFRNDKIIELKDIS